MYNEKIEDTFDLLSWHQRYLQYSDIYTEIILADTDNPKNT